MLQLNNLKPKHGSKKDKKRVGRGTSSGWGKTCGRGHKGQGSRSGGTKGAHFEGGQTPLYRRLPKNRGFKNLRFRIDYDVVNLWALEKFDKEVNREILLAAGLISGKLPVKILGDGEIKKALTITAEKFSDSAKKLIEKAGGKTVTC